nr:peroxide stress protein YaaA [uncultured Gemmiger sp.]
MRIIISPAKKMNVDTDSLDWLALPDFLDRTEQLLTALRGMPYDALKKLWKCNDQLAELNVQRLQTMDLRRHLTPAILSYEGIQYQYMAPGVFTTWEFEYIQEHLRILSGFYGLLRPFDGVTPYRLEMQARLAVNGGKDVYAFWGDTIARELFAETDCIVNLASKEYSVCVSRYLPESVRFVSCIFGEEKDGKVIEKATMCKMARGEMVRFMAENSITKPEEMQAFDRQQFRFSARHSDENTYVFLRDPAAAKKAKR